MRRSLGNEPVPLLASLLGLGLGSVLLQLPDLAVNLLDVVLQSEEGVLAAALLLGLCGSSEEVSALLPRHACLVVLIFEELVFLVVEDLVSMLDVEALLEVGNLARQVDLLAFDRTSERRHLVVNFLVVNIESICLLDLLLQLPSGLDNVRGCQLTKHI